jgi:hypothetical protein
LEFELAELDRSGFTYRRDPDAFEQGVLLLEVDLEIEGRKETLTATYPDLYPYFRIIVEAPSLDLEHHQHPLGKGLCLLGRGTENWHTNMTLATLLVEQLPILLQTAKTDDFSVASGLEEDQAEPFSEYYPYLPETMVLVESEWDIPKDLRGGRLVLGIDNSHAMPPAMAPSHPVYGAVLRQAVLRGAVLEVRDEDGGLVAEASTEVRDIYGGITAEAVWLRVDHEVPEFNQMEFIKHLCAVHPLARTVPTNRYLHGWLQVWGVLFPEETARRIKGEGWVFACRFSQVRHKLTLSSPPARGVQSHSATTRAQRRNLDRQVHKRAKRHR